MNPKPPGPTNDPQPENQDNSEEVLDDNEGGSRFLLFNVMPSWLVSFLCHIAIIIALAIMVMPRKRKQSCFTSSGRTSS